MNSKWKPYLAAFSLLVISPLAFGAPRPLQVLASIDGQPRKFMLDMGANITTLSPDAQSENLPVVGTRQPIAAGGEETTCDLIRIDQLSFDNITDNDLTAQRCHANDNLLGIDSLDKKVFTLTFPDRKLTFLNAAPDETQMSPLTRGAEGHVLLPLEVARSQALALFDTGWSVTAVSSKIIAAHPESFTFLKKSKSTDAEGNIQESNVYRVSYVKIGTLELKNQTVGEYDIPADAIARFGADIQAIVGLSTIQQANWLFDLNKNTWAMEKATTDDGSLR